VKLKEYRETVRRIGPVEAARELEVSYIRYWRWETGASTPNAKGLRRIRDWSDGQVTPNDFV